MQHLKAEVEWLRLLVRRALMAGSNGNHGVTPPMGAAIADLMDFARGHDTGGASPGPRGGGGQGEG